MNTLSILALGALGASLLAPAVANADPAVQTSQASTSTAVQTSADRDTANGVAMAKQHAAESAQGSGYGKQASNDRQGLTRIQDQARQLGATN